MRRFCALSVLLVLFWGAVIAQPGDPNDGQPPGEVPISGIEWLLIGGGLFGAKKIYQRFKSKS